MTMIALQVEGQELASLSKYEWLETNGLGGFASSTITGLNTRRYHGLLIAATKPPVGRVVLLSKVEETVVISGARHELSCNSYPGAVHPQGFRYLKSFWLDPFPISQFKVNDVVIEKSIFMRYGENTTVVQYQVVDWGTQQEITLELRPLIAFRDFHSLTRENGALNGMLGNPQSGVVTIQPYSGLPALRFAYGDGYVGGESCWYRNFDYDAELQRGLDFREDLFCPFTLYFKLDRRRPTATIIASLENHFATDADLMRRTEIQRRNAITAHGQSESERLLLSAADQYIVKRGNQHTVIAGYHWFSDWGRDTMISLPGLTLSIGRYDIAKDILLTFAESVSQGMLPNRFPDAGEAPEYNTVDATLWFFHAIGEYARHTGDHEFVRLRLYPVLKEIIDWHIRGTRHGIRMDEDALLLSGESGVQLTWMDAKVGDWVVTPRHGKPVEIQALWYNALCVMQSLATRFKDSDAMQYQTLSARVIASFNAQFWNAEQSAAAFTT